MADQKLVRDGMVFQGGQLVSLEAIKRKSDRKQQKASTLLGMPLGTARARLVKSMLFDFAKKLEIDTCFRCVEKIESCDELSIEHKDSWLQSEDPASSYFDLRNIAFSHLSCNSRAGIRLKKHASLQEGYRVRSKRNRQQKTTWRRNRRAELRAAGLPYT